MASTRLTRQPICCNAHGSTGCGSRGRRLRSLLRLLGLPCARAPRLSSLFNANQVGVGVGLLRVVCLLSSTYRGGVLPWDPPRRSGPDGDAALRRIIQARLFTRPLHSPLCCCYYRCVLLVGAHHFTAPIALGAGLAQSLTPCCCCLSEPLHDLPRGLVLCFSGVAISAAAAVHDDGVCSRLSSPCMVARQRSLEVRGPAL